MAANPGLLLLLLDWTCRGQHGRTFEVGCTMGDKGGKKSKDKDKKQKAGKKAEDEKRKLDKQPKKAQ